MTRDERERVDEIVQGIEPHGVEHAELAAPNRSISIQWWTGTNGPSGGGMTFVEPERLQAEWFGLGNPWPVGEAFPAVVFREPRSDGSPSGDTMADDDRFITLS